MISLYFDDLSEHTPNVGFYKVDIDEFVSITEYAEVCAVPSFYFFSNGQFVDQYFGCMKGKLALMIEKNLKAARREIFFS